ncbi:spore coat protein CotJB [Aminipila butyrica]|uniref:Spore coat protein CotJB n=1 Tax=Aminipila butyrica TaxID=433296 RepID=A0A858BU28_9FIRM|nr:spore coat protein CotJB [Aminipila butyrica]QIB68578.1 spore coat protein CotJB [Aminipila butyrica]
MNRDELMLRVQMLSFVLVDTNLYLDTHPEDRAALGFFNKYNALYENAKMEYEAKFGPLTPAGTNDTNTWSWIDEPWPWQKEV